MFAVTLSEKNGEAEPKLTWGGQVSAEVLADNRYDHSKSPVHPTGHCHGRDRYASFRESYAKPQTAPSDQARLDNQRGQPLTFLVCDGKSGKTRN